LSVEETSAPYNQFTLPKIVDQDITICSFYSTSMDVKNSIGLIEGEESVRKYILRILNSLKKDCYDIVHIHSPHVGILFLLTKLINRLSSPPSLMTVHNSFKSYKLRNKIFFIPLFFFLDRIVFCSKESYRSFPFYYKRVLDDKAMVIQNGVDVERIDQVLKKLSGDKTNNPTKFKITSVGRITRIKEPFTVMNAYKKSNIKDSSLVFVGEGDLLKSLKQTGNRFTGSKQVEFMGLIPRDQVYRIFNSADLFISTSAGEGLPVAVLEAMACGLPVILSDIAPHREIAEGCKSVKLVSLGNTEGFARALEYYFKMPKKEREIVGKKCREHVVNNFSLKRMLREYDKVYDDMTKKGP